MTLERRPIIGRQPSLRNSPIRAREWRELLERDDVAVAHGEHGDVALVEELGQINLHVAFMTEEDGRLLFPGLFAELDPAIAEGEWPYARVDLIEMPNRTWLEPLLRDAGFRPFGEWMDVERRELRADTPPPEFPDGVRMRRGGEDDHDAIVALEAEAYGEVSDGETATRLRLAAANWLGIVEVDGSMAGYAMNETEENARARILSAAVHPDHRGRGLGRLILDAASYQIASQDATQATVRLSPRLQPAVQAAHRAGFADGRRGIELRRPTDPEIRAAVERQERLLGVKSRFGDWR